MVVVIVEVVALVRVVQVLVVDLTDQLVLRLNHVRIDLLQLGLLLGGPLLSLLLVEFLLGLAHLPLLLLVEAILIADILPLTAFLTTILLIGLPSSCSLLLTILFEITAWIIDLHKGVFIFSVNVHIDVVVFIIFAVFLGSLPDRPSTIVVLNIIHIIILFSIIILIAVLAPKSRLFNRHRFRSLARLEKFSELYIKKI